MRLHGQHQCTGFSIEHLCLSILGARDLNTPLLRDIVEALDLDSDTTVALGKAHLADLRASRSEA
jgi:DNA polymerase III psi subunit